MRLYQFKAMFISKFSLLEAKTKREKELKDIIINKLNYLRMMDLPNLVHTVYLVLKYEDVSEDFKNLCRELLKYVEKLDFENE